MPYLSDTIILQRIRHRAAPEYATVRNALRRLLAQGEQPVFTSQNLVEFWNVCTRPAAARGGFGLTLEETERRARLIECLCALLPDTPLIHQEWRRLVVQHGVTGVPVHDSRLVAAMNVYQVTHILTLNPDDFRRYAGITAVHPQEIN
jgi:predicted nucleic acid-binding protein